jgi:hypothetical protein
MANQTHSRYLERHRSLRWQSRGLHSSETAHTFTLDIVCRLQPVHRLVTTSNFTPLAGFFLVAFNLTSLCSAAGQNDDRHNTKGRDWHMYMWSLQHTCRLQLVYFFLAAFNFTSLAGFSWCTSSSLLSALTLFADYVQYTFM